MVKLLTGYMVKLLIGYMVKMNKTSKIIVKDLGLIDFKAAWDYQEELHAKNLYNKVNNKNVQNYLLLCEHPHVYTIGKSGKENNLLVNEEFLSSKKVKYYKINRGGDITYHGPGQIVGYPIIDLHYFRMGVKEYVLKIENIIINVLAKFGLKGELNDKNIGVWLDAGEKRERKICAIGVKVGKGITMHGFALNVNTDLNYYEYINPCGFIDKGVTSMQKELHKVLKIKNIKEYIINEFNKL